MTCVVGFVTVSGPAEARRIGGAVVREKLAACVNTVPGLLSTYRWKGKIETAREQLLIIKTRRALIPKLTARIKKLHSYTVPEIIFMPIIGGNRDYLAWISDSIGK